ncbi:probable AP-1 complex subunit mu-1-I [Saccharomycodes ludwigii]|uniref:Probable AP-1 complex subunit mu-1-I n=1 Tax=Saccharomycodes ludwigii TaxID=36035 RepID=A0A376B3B8_9ASCO|nr:hypothetical protein SCDLUD_002501 [Saccharomycodes ludwigii]KAH3901031.1 hypothetical protein SCDLUD_002501 [Saccharomycodes ludwigii]SSD59185.1 probable AP-1 complex subunit mu-1-I [Saccharomycodes ludwigii]
MASCIYFCDLKGKPILSRRYRNDNLPEDAIDKFPLLLVEREDETNVLPPVLEFNGVHYLFIQHNDIYVLTLTPKLDINITSNFTFLYQVIDVLQQYCKRVEEESIRDNFVIIYELLDEMMDYGIPQITDTKMLKQYITQKSFKLIKSKKKSKNLVRPPEQLTDSVSWRPKGIVYKKNEAFLDVVESINMTISGASGKVLRSEIIGEVKVRSRLSGMPDLKLGLNDKGIFSNKSAEDDIEGEDADAGVQNNNKKKGDRNIELDDLKFHQCVRLSKFENEKTITFIPPDGDFTLMSYRLTTPLKPLIMCDCKYQIHAKSRVEINCRVKANFKKKSTANNVEILIPVPGDADTPNFRYSHGSIKWAPEKQAIIWKIKNLLGGKEYSMASQLKLPSVEDNESNFSTHSKPPIQIKFQIPYYTTSGIQVKYLKINEPNLQYKSYPWVRYITQSGDDYSIRQ